MNTIIETLTGIVNRVTYHNPDTGWSVLRVQPFNAPQQQETVTVHQTKVFAGATIEFRGAWTIDHKYGRQFKATEAIDKKPATTAAIEKYLGSGLIKGVGPKTAKRIVKHFQNETLDIFENDINRLTEVTGIAKKKLTMIEKAWVEHRAIRDVMIFLQGHGISTLFAVRIYKEYGDKSIPMVTEDPYRLANDFYGIGFFSADKVALSIGLSETSQQRMIAAIKHVLAASREQGHCFLTEQQINTGIIELIEMNLGERLLGYLEIMKQDDQLRTRQLTKEGTEYTCYYSKTLFYDEATVAKKLKDMKGNVFSDPERIATWISRYCQSKSISLSDEQADGVKGVVQHRFSILTGGPGCGKTTTTLVIVRLLEAMKKKVLLAAPTGRATQRMSEVIGREAKTIHRLLEWKGGEFQKNEETPLGADFLIVDECSMLDISLSASLLKAVPQNCQVLFIGDPDQLPSVGAGNVIKDIISSGVIPCFRLTQVFRQAKESLTIKYAHQINKGQTPYIDSPFKKPDIWENGADCLFIDSDEVTKEQISFITRVKRYFDWKTSELETIASGEESPFEFRTQEEIKSAYEQEFVVPDKFKHVDLEKLHKTEAQVDALKSVLKNIHPWSSLHYGLSAIDIVVKLYLEWIPKYHGQDTEIQILTPMTRGSLGTANLNKVIQQVANPPMNGKSQLKVGERIFREGDRVIHRRNNYDLNVFNGDIGKIVNIDNEALTAIVSFYPDNREVDYKKEDIMELDLAYAITIHKSQGSEFKAVIIPVLTQHFKMLYRNLIYTGLTRAKELAVFVGTRKALSMAIRQQDTSQRQTALEELIQDGVIQK
ncbi:MAG: AAA family ATPase [gamma proteobacterium symbiont of Lucinoma myriamae]|nr:AAA family ATPase [gamma proteobacterium symbiont of Lucinoma myriamae]MCU7832407.1 AAA family ATPase [gamma proteobacterium symbiont of Lucinoma myriamae]